MGLKDVGRWVAGAAGGPIGLSMVGDYYSTKAQKDASKKSRDMYEGMYAQGRADLDPWKQYGESELGSFQDWLSDSSAPTYGGDPTMDEVIASPGYQTRLGAVENSAAARGGLLSGNALRKIGEFGADEFDRTRRRNIEDYGIAADAYGRDYGRRAGRMGLGFNAASNMANLGPGFAGGIAGTYRDQGQSQAGMYDAWGNKLLGAAGAIAGLKV